MRHQALKTISLLPCCLWFSPFRAVVGLQYILSNMRTHVHDNVDKNNLVFSIEYTQELSFSVHYREKRG